MIWNHVCRGFLLSRRCVMKWIYPISKFLWKLSVSVVGCRLFLFYYFCNVRIPQGAFLSIVWLWCWYVFYFLLGGKKKRLSEALLECSCLLIDYLSSLRALSLTFEKANNMKPVLIFSFFRSWAFPHLVNSTKGYIISFIFLNWYQNDKVEKIHNCFETDAN